MEGHWVSGVSGCFEFWTQATSSVGSGLRRCAYWPEESQVRALPRLGLYYPASNYHSLLLQRFIMSQTIEL